MDGKIRQKYSEIPFNHFKQEKKLIILTDYSSHVVILRVLLAGLFYYPQGVHPWQSRK